MRAIKELPAWGGTNLEELKASHSDTPDICFQSWPVHPKVFDFVVQGYLRGWGLSGRNVDLKVGTALFARITDVTLWNMACVGQIEDMYGEACDAVDIHGCDSQDRTDVSSFGKCISESSGIQTPQTLTLRTCAQHRMRFIHLHNMDVSNRWANGTRLRLLTEYAWTGAPNNMRRSVVKPELWEVHQINLKDEDIYPEFNLKVIKGDECTLAKKVRFSCFDVQVVPVREDRANHFSGTEERWKQVQAALAYALTGHKAQGLTMDTVYLCSLKIFGFGLPYTMCTRSPWFENMYFVGVPPVDVLAAILRRDATGQNAVERQRAMVENLLDNGHDLEIEMQRRIDTGEFNLKEIATHLPFDTDTPDASSNHLDDPGQREDAARRHLLDKLRSMYTNWMQRLDTVQGLHNMCTVNEGSSFKAGVLTPRQDRKKQQQTTT